MRAVTAKSIVVGTIAAVVAVSLLLRVSWRPAEPPALVSRDISVVAADLPTVRAHAVPTRPGAPRPRPLTTPSISESSVSDPPLAIAPLADSGAEPAIVQADAPALPDPLEPLASRSLAIVVKPVSIAGRQPVTFDEPRGGVLTRAMGTTAEAFKTAGTSVASAFRKVF